MANSVVGEEGSVNEDVSEDGATDPATRIEITGGGEVCPEQLAAIVVALTPSATAGDARAAGRAPAWGRAALLENVGLRRIARPGDLIRPGSRL